MNRKNLPLLLMLVAGIVCCIYTFILQYSTLGKLVSLFFVLLFFYLLGCLLNWTIDSFKAETEKRLMEEGEVIEKGTEGQEDAEGQAGAEGQDDTEHQEGAQEGIEQEESESQSPA